MNLLRLGFKNLIAEPLSALLCTLLFGFGISIVLFILLSGSFLRSEITKNAQGIDMVVGAKGSPLQIILSSVFHIDFPTGNISLKEAAKLTKSRLVRSSIPMSIGDSYIGYRIVGTTKAYAELYGAELEEGNWFDGTMRVVAGSGVRSELGLTIGDTIESSHGLVDGGGHAETPYTVGAILTPTGTILDQLLLVSVQDIWSVHSHKEDHEHQEEWVTLEKMGLVVSKEQLEEEEITSLLIKFRSPMAAVLLSRTVNEMGNLQAASPPYEMARLFNMIGIGIDLITSLALAIIILSAIGVFIALFNSLKERKYELAIMRSMGASRFKIFSLIMIEGILITLMGNVLGFGLAHGGMIFLDMRIESIRIHNFLFIVEEYYVLLGSMGIGILGSIIPAILAYRVDISKTLSKA